MMASLTGYRTNTSDKHETSPYSYQLNMNQFCNIQPGWYRFFTKECHANTNIYVAVIISGWKYDCYIPINNLYRLSNFKLYQTYTDKVRLGKVKSNFKPYRTDDTDMMNICTD